MKQIEEITQKLHTKNIANGNFWLNQFTVSDDYEKVYLTGFSTASNKKPEATIRFEKRQLFRFQREICPEETAIEVHHKKKCSIM